MAAKQLELDAEQRGGGVPSCANCCGLFGTARTKNLCARCYRDHLNAVDNAAEAVRTRALLASLAGSCLGAAAAAAIAAGPETEEKKAASMCASCRRKVGLLGFACRCGGTFCSRHRQGDAHGFGFDFKRTADENLAVVAQASAGRRLAIGAEQRARDSTRDHQVEVGDGEDAAFTRLRRRRMIRTCE